MKSPIALFRQKLNLTQTDLAILANISLPTIVAMENGVSKPNQKLLQALALLGANISELGLAQNSFIEAKRSSILARIK